MYYVRNVAWTIPATFSGERNSYIYSIPVCKDIPTLADAMVIAEVAALEYAENPVNASADPITCTERNSNGFTCVHDSGELMEFRVFSGAFGAVGDNSGHGHVWERPDGNKARCGGPQMCMDCKRDEQRVIPSRNSIFLS